MPAAIAVAVRVKVEEPDPVTVAGLKLEASPVGSGPLEPLRLKLTVPLKPFRGDTVTFVVVLLPWLTLGLVGETEMPKSLGVIVKDTGVV